MGMLIMVHGEVRWLIAIVAIIAIVKFALGWLQKASYKKMDRGLMSAYTGLMDLNLLLGLIIIIFGGGLNAPRIEHTVTMILAVVTVHASAAWRKSKKNRLKFRNNLIVIVVSLALVFVGVMRLRGGWVF